MTMYYDDYIIDLEKFISRMNDLAFNAYEAQELADMYLPNGMVKGIKERLQRAQDDIDAITNDLEVWLDKAVYGI